ncbi:cysteine desulfurase family protein [Methylacidimicrobium tartarophylax]|uniref:Cysteine desulfurase n=1 Tax=Methylacidimicrobium tartarophylax TaxID=1041768 RepID=A0A5E6M8U9_9BACT|nr:cysteine desulfurase family protein [Methylacidimicrobium tartarophylax]VVM04822.1 cysteine desulfurase [Methylacidimicrobium tartarophylax]
MSRIYLDYNATTPLEPRARAAMEPYLDPRGNPSSLHAEGRSARAAVDLARERIAALLRVQPREIVFTASGSQSDTLGVVGLARGLQKKGRHLICSAVEHPAVLKSMAFLEEEGFTVCRAPVDRFGAVRLEALEESFRPETTLVSILSASNEIGTRQPMRAIGELCEERGVVFHSDVVQSAGKEELCFAHWGVSSASLAAHKFGGPLGGALLYVRAGLPLDRVIFGGEQEGSRWAGTENVAAIVGMAEALACAEEERENEAVRQRELTELLWHRIADLPRVVRWGDPVERLSNTLAVSCSALDGENLLIGLDLEGIAVSGGAACSSGTLRPSPVLLALGASEAEARSMVRFSLGKGVGPADIEESAARFRKVVLEQLAG